MFRKNPGALPDFTHPLTRKLEAWWLMAEGGGRRLSDISGRGNHAVLNHDTSIKKWIGGKSSGSSVQIASGIPVTVFQTAPKTVITKNWTMCGWIKPTTLAVNSTFFNTRAAADFTFDAKLQTDGVTLDADIGNGTSWINTSFNAVVSYKVNHWYHVAYAISPTGGKIYWNGKLVATYAWATDSPMLWRPTSPVQLSGGVSAVEQFYGAMDDFRAYSRTLSGAEIAQLVREPYVGLQRLWRVAKTSGISHAIALNAVGASAALLSRSIGKLAITSVVTSTSTLAKQITKAFTVTSIALTSINKSIAKLFSAASSGVAVFAKSVGKVLSVTSSSAISFAKAVGKIATVSVSSTATLIKTVSKSLIASSLSTASFVVTKITAGITHSLTFTVTSTSTVLLQKAVSKTFNIAVSSASAIYKSISKSIAASSGSIAAITKRIAKYIGGTCGSFVSFVVLKILSTTVRINARYLSAKPVVIRISSGQPVKRVSANPLD